MWIPSICFAIAEVTMPSACIVAAFWKPGRYLFPIPVMSDRQSPPGRLIDVGGYHLHLQVMGEASPTVVLDHSLGGIEGYLLIQEIAKLSRVCIYDRAGYSWSEQSPQPRTSEQIERRNKLLCY